MPATTLDKALVIPNLGLILTKTTLAALTGPFRGSEGAPTYLEHVLNTFVRGILTHLSIEQVQWLLPPFVDSYKSWCTKHNIPADVIDIPNTTTQGFWLGAKSTAKYTLVYFHGGGYMAPGTAQHLDMLMNFVKWSNNNLAVFCVAYTLAPGAEYPSQIAECVEGTRYILNLQGHSPETTLLGGDSAGGALVFAVLSHLSHPHPQSNIVNPLDIKTNLRGAITIAPWASSDGTKYPSIHKFASRDIVNHTNATYWSEAYKGRGKVIKDDEYIYAALATPQWWKETKCDEVLVVAGAEEGLIDSVKDLVKKFEEGAGSAKIKFVAGERETHDAPLTPLPEAQLEEFGDRKQEGAIRLWIKKNLA